MIRYGVRYWSTLACLKCMNLLTSVYVSITNFPAYREYRGVLCTGETCNPPRKNRIFNESKKILTVDIFKYATIVLKIPIKNSNKLLVDKYTG